MDEPPHEPDKDKVTPILRGTSHRANASEDQRVQDEIQKLLKDADTDPPKQTASLAPLTESKVIIEQGRHGPPADHPNAMVCPQCHEWTWKATDSCWNCGLNLRRHLEQEQADRLAREKARNERLLREFKQERIRQARNVVLIGIGLMMLSPLVPAHMSKPLLIIGVGLLLVAAGMEKFYG